MYSAGIFKGIFKAVFMLVLLAVTYILYAIFGKRELERMPGNMVILCTNPALRYLFYALGGVLLVFVGGVMVLCYLDGGYDNAGMELFIYQGIALFAPCLLFVSGYILYARHVFFNNDYLVIGRPFRPSVKMYWYEAGKMVVKNKNHFMLYNRDGELCVNATSDMQNYNLFYNIAIKHLKPYKE